MKKRELTEKQVVEIFNIIKRKALEKMQRGCWEQSIRYIEAAARWGYSYNFKYVDDTLEQLLQNISDNIKNNYLLNDNCSIDNRDERIVFICNRTIDCGELTRQYSKALAKLEIPILIITLNRTVRIKEAKIGSIETPSYLENKSNVFIKIVKESDSFIVTSKEVAEAIRNFNPTKILTHVWPWDARLIVAVMAAKQCPCYNINFNDHSFWIGKSMLDYLIEFRPYGASISVQKRGLKMNQLLYLPYYPIISDGISFEGFPFDREGKIVILTGGTEYKMLGEDNLFFEIMDTVLEENPKAVIFLVSTSLAHVKKRISNMKNRERVYTSFYRKDISELFRNCDIYYGTYPLSGGLMSQYAAIHAKPILAYANNKIGLEEMDGVINYHIQKQIAKNDLISLFDYAKRLCNDLCFRESEGNRLYCSLIEAREFDVRFAHLLDGGCNFENMKILEIDYDRIKRFYIDFANNYADSYLSILIRVFKFKTFIYFPHYSVLFVVKLLEYTKRIITFFVKSFCLSVVK